MAQFLISEMSEFQKIGTTFVSLIDEVAKEVEKEKMMVRKYKKFCLFSLALGHYLRPFAGHRLSESSQVNHEAARGSAATTARAHCGKEDST